MSISNGISIDSIRGMHRVVCETMFKFATSSMNQLSNCSNYFYQRHQTRLKTSPKQLPNASPQAMYTIWSRNSIPRTVQGLAVDFPAAEHSPTLPGPTATNKEQNELASNRSKTQSPSATGVKRKGKISAPNEESERISNNQKNRYVQKTPKSETRKATQQEQDKTRDRFPGTPFPSFPEAP